MANPSTPAFTINGNGKQVRDVMHADDLIRAYKMAVQNIRRTAGKIYNIGGGPANSLSLLELFQLLASLTGNSMRFRHLDWRPGDQKVFVADTQRANEDFGWQPEVSKESGIKNMLEWCRNINYEQPNPR
jgi:CDP-paratose 2-epimerase